MNSDETMKTTTILLAAALGIGSVAAQTPPTPPPGTISRSPGALAPNSTALPANRTQAQRAASSLSFTNQYGATFTFNDLAAQLSNLRDVAERVQPMLGAFNNEYATAPAGSSRAQQLRSAVSGLLSGLLNRNQTGAGTSAQTKPGLGSLTGLLRGLINTNNTAPGSAQVNRTTLAEFQKLQAGLQPVISLLQNLNIPPANYTGRQTSPPAVGAPAPDAFSGTNSQSGSRPLRPQGK
jgi:hypothetical protein